MWSHRELTKPALKITFFKRFSSSLPIFCINSSPRSLLRMKSLMRSCLQRREGGKRYPAQTTWGFARRRRGRRAPGSWGGGAKCPAPRLPPPGTPPRSSCPPAPRGRRQPWRPRPRRVHRRHGDRASRWLGDGGAGAANERSVREGRGRALFSRRGRALPGCPEEKERLEKRRQETGSARGTPWPCPAWGQLRSEPLEFAPS